MASIFKWRKLGRASFHLVCFRFSVLEETPEEPRGWKRTKASRVSKHHTTRSNVFSRPLQFRTSHLTKTLEQALTHRALLHGLVFVETSRRKFQPAKNESYTVAISRNIFRTFSLLSKLRGSSDNVRHSLLFDWLFDLKSSLETRNQNRNTRENKFTPCPNRKLLTWH